MHKDQQLSFAVELAYAYNRAILVPCLSDVALNQRRKTVLHIFWAGRLVALLTVSFICFGGVPKDECFPVQRLPPELQPKAEELLLEAADSTALYTLVGVKPMTSSFLERLGRGGALVFKKADFRNGSAIFSRVDELRQLLAALRCGDDISAALIIDSGDMYAGEDNSAAEPFVFNMPAVRRVIARHADYLAKLGVTQHTSPETMLFYLERLFATRPRERQAAQLWYRQNELDAFQHERVRGELYGYPRSAVEAMAAFVKRFAAGEKPSPDDPKTAPVMRIPVHNGMQFVYRKAAPDDMPDDAALRERANAILAEYRKRRERYIVAGNRGIVSLLRDWFCHDETGCAAENVTYPEMSK